MKIKHTFPPNIERIREVMGSRFLAEHADAYFCYGDSIYIPSGGKISKAEIAHEHVHSIRQGEDPDGWWEQWLTDMEFRILEELIAHRVEYRVAAHGANRAQRRGHLTSIARRMAGPLYGKAISFAQAKRLIGEEPSTNADMEDVSLDPPRSGREPVDLGCIPPGTAIEVPSKLSHQGLKCAECGAYIPAPEGKCNMPACPHVVKRVAA